MQGKLTLLLVLSSGCATYGAYTCPAPIGEIVRDDCGVYKTQYQALSVDLGFTIQGVGVSAKVSQDALRAVPELIQVLEHQSLQMCRDFNSCRLPPADYQRRRENADRVFTAVTAISAQLKNPKLTEPQRQELISSLIAIVNGKPPPSRLTTKSAKKRRRDPFYRPRTPKMVPPSPEPRGKGVPRLVGVAVSSTNAWLRFAPYAATDIQDDDVVDFGGVRCPVRRQRRYGGTATCRLSAPPPSPVEVVYVAGVTGARTSLGSLTTDPDALMSRAWVAFETQIGDDDNELFERPVLRVQTGRKERGRVFARCKVNGTPVGGALRALRSVRFVTVQEQRIPLPFVVQTQDGLSKPPGPRFDAERHAGPWVCAVSVDGAPRYEVRFTLDAEGRPTLDAAALEAQGPLRPGWFPAALRRASP